MSASSLSLSCDASSARTPAVAVAESAITGVEGRAARTVLPSRRYALRKSWPHCGRP